MFNFKSNPPFSGKIQQILDNIERLKPLPGTSRRILKVVENPRATAKQVIDIIKTDQALAADVIRMANSASLGYRVPCNSIETAVVRIGFKRVRALALRSFASGPLTQRLSGYRMEEKSLWQHSLATAKYADLISQLVSYPDPEDAYVAGLLHDMGKLLLDQYVLDDYQKIIDMMVKEEKPLWEIEERLFGIDHAVIGGLMAEKWRLPTKLAEGIRFHHMPSLSKRHRVMVAVVHVANALTPPVQAGIPHLEGKVIGEEALQILNLDQQKIQRLRERLANSLKDDPLLGKNGSSQDADK